MQASNYSLHPHLIAKLTPREKRALKHHKQLSRSQLEAARYVLGKEVLKCPPVADHQSDTIVSFRQEGDNPYASYAQDISLYINQRSRSSPWAGRNIYPVHIIRMYRVGEPAMQVRKCVFNVPLEKYQSISQQYYYSAALLSIFKQRLEINASKLTVAEAHQISTLRFAETHLLLRRQNGGGHQAYMLEEVIGAHTLPKTTSDTNFCPPTQEGKNTLVDVLYAFTHFTYEHHNATAIMYGFHVQGNTIFKSLMVDQE
ncbi:hypothetical protein DFH28DRAFT_921391 [Melampsora americana]|nr:hypothetical protein DFH28DRAFT_921391 [Melampsora americana]